jgi:isopenicillin N synthase-like dioxygenase
MSLQGEPPKAASTLPIIHIAPWIEGHDHKGRLSTAAAIHAACLEFGFFYLDVSSYVDPAEAEELSRLAREFFSLPTEEKDKISRSKQDDARGTFLTLLSGVSPMTVHTYRIPTTKGECHYGQGR